MRIVAIIPVKEKSERVPSKNFKTFSDEKSLLDILLEKLLKIELLGHIYISTNKKDLDISHKKISILERDEKYCNNITPWSDVITHIANSIPEKDETSLVWCHTTSPLFDEYDKAVKLYKSFLNSNEYDGLITVSELTKFIVSEKKQPINYSWGPWHTYSQNLEKLYSITYALFIAKKIEMVRNRYVISKNPFFYKVSPYQSIDIDSNFDFKLSQLLLQNKEKFIDA